MALLVYIKYDDNKPSIYWLLAFLISSFQYIDVNNIERNLEFNMICLLIRIVLYFSNSMNLKMGGGHKI